MCTFFARCVALAVLLAGCGRAPAPKGAPAPRADTLVVPIPVVRLTPAQTAEGSVPIDSVTLALLERRIMSRVASMLRVESQLAAGKPSAGIPPVKSMAPDIRHGLLGTIAFDEEGAIDESSRQRLDAVAGLLAEVRGTLELRATADLSATANIDIAIARARRVYLDLIARNRELAQRDVAITIAGVTSLTPINPTVEIFFRE